MHLLLFVRFGTFHPHDTRYNRRGTHPLSGRGTSTSVMLLLSELSAGNITPPNAVRGVYFLIKSPEASLTL